MLSQAQQQFIFKRTLFQKVSGYIVWSLGLTTVLAWGLMFLLKPEMVSPQAVLTIIKAKTDSGIDVTQLTDIVVLAVTGATAISAVFISILLLWKNLHRINSGQSAICNLKPAQVLQRSGQLRLCQYRHRAFCSVEK